MYKSHHGLVIVSWLRLLLVAVVMGWQVWKWLRRIRKEQEQLSNAFLAPYFLPSAVQKPGTCGKSNKSVMRTACRTVNVSMNVGVWLARREQRVGQPVTSIIFLNPFQVFCSKHRYVALIHNCNVTHLANLEIRTINKRTPWIKVPILKVYVTWPVPQMLSS